MNTKAIANRVSGVVSRTGLKLRKHSPEILVVSGIVGTVVSTVMACKATTKVSQIVEEAKYDLQEVHSVKENPKFADRYSEEDARKDTAIIYAQTGLKLAKLYAPAVALGTISVASILYSHKILKKRNAALAAAYATVNTAFKEYRGRVAERWGEAVEREIRYNLKSKEIEENVVDPETGEVKTVKKTVDVVDINDVKKLSPHVRVFDETNPNWEKSPELNMMFLRAQQQYANDLLMVKGHLFLNELYEMLGFEKSQAGQFVGWVYNPKKAKGDNYIDLGLYDCYGEDIHSEAKRRFINGLERSILIEPNIDGDIYSLMADPEYASCFDRF